jgi:hypothetical protein
MTTNAVDKCLFAITEAEEVEVERELRRPAPFSPAWPTQASLVPRTTHGRTAAATPEAVAFYALQAAEAVTS